MSKDKVKDKLKKAIKKQAALKLVTSKAKTGPIVIERPAITDMNPPQGFRVVSISQALQEFSSPIMERFDGEDMDTIKRGYQLSTLLWNYAIGVEINGTTNDALEKTLSALLCDGIGLNKEEAKIFLDEVINRKKYLFPPDIQPMQSNIMFIRKEVSHLIHPFDYSTVDISMAQPYVPDAEDIQLKNKLRQMDKNIINEAEYDSWEEFCLAMEQECGKRFNAWLNKKGINKELANDFSFNIDVYLTFTYRYMHEDFVLLENVPEHYLREFFFDYILRKVTAQPNEYLFFMPTLKLFYRFLAEIKYLENPEPVIAMLDDMEPAFIEELRKRYS